MIIILGLKNFFIHFYNAMTSVFYVIISILTFLIGYPAQEAILIAALALFVFDIITKFYAIGVQNGGLIKAFKIGKLSSRGFWNGFLTKIIGYFIILTIGNLAIITPQIAIIGTIISVVCYTGLFFYECISNFENLRDAGFKLALPILNRLKKEQKKFLENETENITNSVNSETSNDSVSVTVSNNNDTLTI